MNHEFNSIKHSALMPRYLQVSLMATALLLGSTHSAEAHSPNILDHVAEQQLDHDLAKGNKVPVLPQYDVLWSSAGQDTRQYEYRTEAPLYKKVAGVDRYFKLAQDGQTLDSLRVTILPKNASVVFNQYAHPPNPAITDTPRMRHIQLDDYAEPVFKRVINDSKQVQSVPVGQTTTPKPQIISDGGGKRFASTAMINDLWVAKTLPQAQAIIQNFMSQYDVESEIEDAHTSIKDVSYATVQPVDLSKVRTFGVILIDQFSKYPLDYIRMSGLRKIIFGNDLRQVGEEIGAVSDGLGNLVFGSVLDLNTDAEKQAIHHELTHQVKAALTGSPNQINDAAWNAINPAGFDYIGNGIDCAFAATSCLTGDHVEEGFASGYATAAIDEDEPETTGYLMTSAGSNQLAEWSITDPILARKVALLKNFMFVNSGGLMNDQYFKEINP